MSKKKSGKKRPQPARPPIMLSQCMIVKNEEKNIERALGWAKDIVFEQIVVDTGSTDNTVELAKRMGAKVYHFDWIDDFSAAKNFAIEKATGNWIVFLDADEYFSPEDTIKFMIFLRRIQADPQMRENYLAMGCQFIDIDENGTKIGSGVQLRAFRNIPSIRYTGSIHERLDMNGDNIVLVDEIKIIHTGYGTKKIKEKGTTERNLKILRQEYSKNPDDLNTKAYLADSLKNINDEESNRETETLYTEVINSGVHGLVHYTLKFKAYLYLMRTYINRPEMAERCKQICEQGLDEFPNQLDFMYYLAYVKNNSGEYQSAWDLLKTCSERLSKKLDVTETYNIILDPTLLYSQMVIAAQGLGDTENTIKYVTLILKEDKTRPGLLQPYIRRLLEIGKTTEELIIQLKAIYDFENPDDLQYIANTANECGAFELAEKVKGLAKQPPYCNNGLRLSQCMIVKNEEKNIERALSWAKGFVVEQIVVDTGSTDRTVEIAKENGASVYHFDWIDDFAAAKNFAMDKATGNWIAILDADEYMLCDDAAELMAILENIQSDETLSNEYEAVMCSLVDFDDYERVISVSSQIRVFQNLPYLRYNGRIHEGIALRKSSYKALNLRIFHTGYSKSVFADANKQERNVNLLRKELERDPENANIMLYLADMLKNDSAGDACREAEDLYIKALSGKYKVNATNKQIGYSFLIPRFIGDEEKNDEALRLCDEAITQLPDHLDYFFYRAVLNNKLGKYEEARSDLAVCGTMLSSDQSFPITRIMVPSPLPLYIQLRISAQGMGDEEEAIKNTDIIRTMLSGCKDQTDTMGGHISAMLKHGLSEDEALDELANFYDLHNPADLLFVARAAKESGAISFTRKIMEIADNVMKGMKR